MRNIDQIRGENALVASRRREPAPNSNPPPKANIKAVDKLPALIVNNGLLAAAAFALEKAKNDRKLQDAIDAVAWHLSDVRIGRLPSDLRNTEQLIQHLCASNSGTLRLATNEALAFLSYLKRFAQSDD